MILPVVTFQSCWRLLLASQIKTYFYLVDQNLDICLHVSEMLKSLTPLFIAEGMLVLYSSSSSLS